MATKLVNCSRLASYMPTFRLAVKWCRPFSSASDTFDIHVQEVTDKSTKTQTVWPDHILGPLGPQDKRFPMPGRVGPCVNPVMLSEVINPTPVTPPVFDPDNVLPRLPTERHSEIAEQFLTSLDEIDVDFIDRGVSFPVAQDRMEYRAHRCPVLLRKEFKELFPDRNLMEDNLTVMTVCFHTECDMTSWSSGAEKERKELLDTFIEAAVGICQTLEDSGHWADFIDPSSGKPFKGPDTSFTLFETDERYEKLGFEIQDLGNCKVIRHPDWGTHVYVGSLFTSAACDHPLIVNLTTCKSV